MAWLRGNNDSFVDVFGEAAAQRSLTGAARPWSTRAYGLYAAETLLSLYAMLPTSSEGKMSTLARPLRGLLGALLFATRARKMRVGLQLAVEDECGSSWCARLCGFNHLIHASRLGRAFGGE